MKGKYLITTDNWFVGPDGVQYRAVWGEVEILTDNILGVKTNSRSTNWYAKIGNDDKHVIVAGCQIHYACKTTIKPDYVEVDDYSVENGEIKKYKKPTLIYIAE